MNRRILLIEDNPSDVLFIREALAETGTELHLDVVGDGEKGLEFLRNEGTDLPDLVIVDINLPRLEGLEVLEEIRHDPNLRRLPVIVLSTSDLDRDIDRAYDLHANAYVVKRHDYTEIVQAIASFWFSVA